MLKRFLKCLFVVSITTSPIYSAESETVTTLPDKSLSVIKGLPDLPTSDIDYKSFVVGKLYDRQRAELSKSSIYFLVTAYEQEKFAQNLARSLKLNYDRLRKFGVDFQIRLTCDGRDEDRVAFESAFLSLEIPQRNFIISLNPTNKGVSFTRYEQLLSSREEIMRDIASGKHVYFSVFDGDDMMHQDWCRLMLATALETNAGTMSLTQMGVECFEEDIDIIHDFQVRPILNKQLQYENANDYDFTTILFKAAVMYRDDKLLISYPSLADPFTHLDTLLPLVRFFKNKGGNFSISDSCFYQRIDRGLFGSADVSDLKCKSFIPMFFYMQHSGSMEHNQLERMLKIYPTILNSPSQELVIRSIVENRDIFLFGIPEAIDPDYIVTHDRNTTLTEEFLIENFKNNHILAHNFQDIVSESKTSFWTEKEIETRTNFILEHPKTQELLAQDISNPLSEDFIKTFIKMSLI